LYSFDRDQAGLDSFYDDVAHAYERIFQRCGIGDRTYKTFASGGSFSKYSHEYQTVSEAGEDTIYVDKTSGVAVNEEVYTDEVLSDLGLSREAFVPCTAIEVGNIFKLGTKFSEPLGLTYADEQGNDMPVVMGSYGIGPSRLMGTVAEVLSDDVGLVWPKAVAPYAVHLVRLGEEDAVVVEADSVYRTLSKAGVSVLYDDRDVRAGEKFADSDLLGMPTRIVVSKKTLETGAYEVVDRATGERSVAKDVHTVV